MLRIVFSMSALLILSACSPSSTPEEKIRTALVSTNSADIKETIRGTRRGNYCGKVKSKSRRSAHDSYTPFLVEESTNTTAIVAPLDREDFHTLWRIRDSDLFMTQFNDIRRRCMFSARWKEVCGEAYPDSRHELCTVMGEDRLIVLKTLKAEFGR